MKIKFKCVRKDGLETSTVVLEPVEGPAFAGAPYGTVSLGPLTPEAANAFVVGEVIEVPFGDD